MQIIVTIVVNIFVVNDRVKNFEAQRLWLVKKEHGFSAWKSYSCQYVSKEWRKTFDPENLKVFVWAYFQPLGSAILKNNFCPRFLQAVEHETMMPIAKFPIDDSILRREQLLNL